MASDSTHGQSVLQGRPVLAVARKDLGLDYEEIGQVTHLSDHFARVCSTAVLRTNPQSQSGSLLAAVTSSIRN